MSPPSSQTQGSATQGVRLSMATENYLLTIFRLEERDFRVTPSQLAEHLKMLPENEGVGTSLPSVGGMIRRMAREGLAESGPNKDVVLTKKGRQSAEMIVRRHRLAERLVVDLLGIDLHRAHIEAHLLEHAISAELEKKIEQRLGEPTTCPFGHPIPGSSYVPNEGSASLDKAATNQALVIDSVPEDDQGLLEYLVSHRLVPGQKVTVKEASPTRGVLTLQVDSEEVVFSYDVASMIMAYPDSQT